MLAWSDPPLGRRLSVRPEDDFPTPTPTRSYWNGRYHPGIPWDIGKRIGVSFINPNHKMMMKYLTILFDIMHDKVG